MSGGAAAQTLRDSAMRLNHRLRRFAGANALKKIALNVIAEVRKVAAEVRKVADPSFKSVLGLRVQEDSAGEQLGQSLMGTCSTVVFPMPLVAPIFCPCLGAARLATTSLSRDTPSSWTTGLR